MGAPLDWARGYGRWAVVAGASEGLGAAFAEALAARGQSLVLLARREDALERAAGAIREAYDVAVETRAVDLGAPGLAALLAKLVRGREVGVGVYNAAYAPRGAFLARPLDDLERVIDVNVRGPLIFARTLAPEMVARKRGALVLMSSLAGLTGSPRIAAYAATKAFNIVLAESLWAELRGSGVDVVASCAGAVRTPGYVASSEKAAEPPGTLDPKVVAEQTLRGLGGGPRVVPGLVNQVASLVIGRLLSRRAAISIMGSSTRDLE